MSCGGPSFEKILVIEKKYMKSFLKLPDIGPDNLEKYKLKFPVSYRWVGFNFVHQNPRNQAAQEYLP